MADMMHIDLDTLYDVVKQARTRRGLSFRECANQIGISHVMLQRLEDGRVPKAHSLQRVLAWLDAPAKCAHCGQELPS